MANCIKCGKEWLPFSGVPIRGFHFKDGNLPQTDKDGRELHPFERMIIAGCPNCTDLNRVVLDNYYSIASKFGSMG